MTTRLKEQYEQKIVAQMREEFGYQNIMEVPCIEKIVVNMGVGEASQDKKKIEGALSDMTLITGQKPIVTRAKKSIAGFKLREEMMVGCKVTLRKAPDVRIPGSLGEHRAAAAYVTFAV